MGRRRRRNIALNIRNTERRSLRGRIERESYEEKEYLGWCSG